MYVGVRDEAFPLGEIVVGVAGTEGAAVFGVTDFPSLQGLVPKLLDALTNQLYVAPLASAFDGVMCSGRRSGWQPSSSW